MIAAQVFCLFQVFVEIVEAVLLTSKAHIEQSPPHHVPGISFAVAVDPVVLGTVEELHGVAGAAAAFVAAEPC